MVAGLGKVWAVGHRNGVVYEIDPATGRLVHATPVGGIYYVGLTTHNGAVFTYRDDARWMARLDGRSGRVLASRRVSAPIHELLSTGDALWGLTDAGPVQIDPDTFAFSSAPRRAIRNASQFTYGGGSLWVGGREIGRFDARTGSLIKRYPISGTVQALAAGPGAVYYVRPDQPYVFRLSIPSGRLTRLARVTSQPGRLAIAGNQLLVTDDARNSITPVNLESGAVGKRLVLRNGPAAGNNQPDGLGLQAIAIAGGAVYAADWDANKVYRVPLAKLGL